jgi:hypothetical protein
MVSKETLLKSRKCLEDDKSQYQSKGFTCNSQRWYRDSISIILQGFKRWKFTTTSIITWLYGYSIDASSVVVAQG